MTTTQRRGRSVTAVAVAAIAITLTACGGGGDSGRPATATTTTNPGPNPTPAVDPGPNDTSHGPTTMAGTVKLERDCVVLEVGPIRFDLRLHGYEVKRLADGRAIVGSEGTPLARDGDTLYVAGYDLDRKTACGEAFDVESLVSALPR